MAKIKKGDIILIMKGKDKGKKAKVLSVDAKKGKIVADNINVKKKHQGPRRQGQKGSIVQIFAPFDASKAMLLCPKCSKPARVGYKIAKGGGKARICKKCKSEI